MDLLFKREQTKGKLVSVQFKLWSKIELNEEEQALINRYKFNDAVLISALQPNLIRKTLFIGIGVLLLVFTLLSSQYSFGSSFFFALIAGGVAGYWYLNEKRETIFVKDLLHGRHFSCDSVVELARKEAWLETVVAYLRQVMENAKHWDGVQRHDIEALPKDEARQIILKGL